MESGDDIPATKNIHMNIKLCPVLLLLFLLDYNRLFVGLLTTVLTSEQRLRSRSGGRSRKAAVSLRR